MINVLGGTYLEIDYDDISTELYGSGFRATKFLLENNCPTKYSTVGNSQTVTYLNENKKAYKNFSFYCKEHHELIVFKYCFSLDEPEIIPSLQCISRLRTLNVSSDNIIVFGLLEAALSIQGQKVVYDPQTAERPEKFSEFGKAEELIYVVNKKEAQSIAGTDNIDEIIKYFFQVELVTAFIIKNGPYGASLYLEDKIVNIPSYITYNVNKIGSGDVFTGSFGYYWMERKLSIEDAALYASRSTAIYCDLKAYVDTSILENFKYREYKHEVLEKMQVYIASPFFSLSDLILIEKVRSAFLSFGINVFSPFHDIGIGDHANIAKKDLEAIENSDIIFLVLDNLDSGTLIEAGYSMAKGKKMVAYHRTCTDDKLLMLKPANVDIFKHLTTAIYHTIWKL
ncbi:PfkB family carbohydrate kinase [Chryseobacterium salipaludis]|uniref:PfkB family carbohydrate kinase n=1 Tax=Chryseobacterium TaxID=59732 RepID=UPI001FF14372|nr:MULTISPECIES: PfkB family carbohydrate kinase [Chryseobacterium]MCJ8498610.1 PfkB family carbohydrate kinase [Chryseobacterium salipaludis]MCX3297740.1 PfkB family carbohydrate kinase [Planobacterium sp. JC490]